MTNINMSSKAKPFLLKPVGKDYLWGGSRLNDDFSKGIDLEPLAETWECSTHPDGTSSVASGEFCGRLLSEVLKEHPEFLGTHPEANGELPILIKFIDAIYPFRCTLMILTHLKRKTARRVRQNYGMCSTPRKMRN